MPNERLPSLKQRAAFLSWQLPPHIPYRSSSIFSLPPFPPIRDIPVG